MRSSLPRAMLTGFLNPICPGAAALPIVLTYVYKERVIVLSFISLFSIVATLKSDCIDLYSY